MRSLGDDVKEPGQAELPRVAVFWEQASASPLELADAARGLCRIVWVVGWSMSKAEMTFPDRIMARLGVLVDITGKSEKEVLDLLRPHELQGVVAFTDSPQVLAAKVAASFGLPFNSVDAARRSSDKFEQRSALQKAGIPVPGFIKLKPSDFPKAADRPLPLAYPAVLKPCHGSGSRDTFFVRDDADLRRTLELCDKEDFILEEFLEGSPEPASKVGADIVSVESVLLNGVAHHFGVTGRFPFAPPFRETGSFFPSDCSLEDRRAVLTLATAAISSLCLSHGAVHTEIKLTPSGPRLIEINPRVGGLIAFLVARLGGPPLAVLAFRLALGLEVEPPPAIVSPLISFARWIPSAASATDLDDIAGIDRLRALPGVESIAQNKRQGDRLDAREGGATGYLLAVKGAVGSHQELRQLLAEIDNSLTVTYGSAQPSVTSC